MARVPGLNTNFDNISSATINLWMARNYVPNVASHHPVLFMLYKKGNVRKDSGYSYVYPFRYPSPVGPKVTGIADGFTKLPAPTEMGGFSAFNFTPALFELTIAIDIYDDMAQGPDTTRIPYYESKMAQGLDGFTENFQNQIWAPEGNSGTGGTRRDTLCSLRTLYNGGGSSSTAGGVPDAKPNQKTAAVGTSPLTLVGGVERNAAGGYYQCPNLYTTDTQMAMSVLGQIHTATQRNNDRADFIITGERVYNFLDSVVNAQQRYLGGESALAKVGFSALRYKNAEIVFDDGCPSIDTGASRNHLFAINTDHLFWNTYTNKPVFREVNSPEYALRIWQGYQMGQLCVDDTGRSHARHAAITNTGI